MLNGSLQVNSCRKDQYQVSKVLVTGGLGFIGSHLVDDLVAKGHEVTVIDNLSTGSEANANPNARYIEYDVNGEMDYERIGVQDYVFHYAACVGVQRTLHNPRLVFEDIEGMKHIMDFCKCLQVKRLFFSSSSEVYGEPVEVPQHEESTPLNSRLPYAIVKNLIEAYLKTNSEEVKYTIFRFFNTYGERQRDDFVISKFIKSALRNEPITIYGNGSQTRSFMYIKDNIRATTSALDIYQSENMTINIGSGVEVTVSLLAEMIRNFADSSSEIIYLPPLKEGDMTRRCPDTRRMENLLDFHDYTSLEDGLRKLIEYEKAN